MYLEPCTDYLQFPYQVLLKRMYLEPYTEYLKFPRKILLKSIHVELESQYIQRWQELGETFGDMLRVQSHLADYRVDVQEGYGKLNP